MRRGREEKKDENGSEQRHFDENDLSGQKSFDVGVCGGVF